MIIACGKRRLVSLEHCWKIEIKVIHRESGKPYWREDRPAYPSSLADACEMLCERELTDRGDITLDELPQALKTAAHTVREYMKQARRAA